jgi:hypothetical protein
MRRRIIAPMTDATFVPLPPSVLEPFEVYVNGVLQERGSDYEVRGRALRFERELRTDRVSSWRWLIGAFGIGTYRQDDSIDVSYVRDGQPRIAEHLAVERRAEE